MNEIIDKVTRWCAYQDRSEFECMQKLLSFGVSNEEAEKIIQYLKDENYLNEKRFVESFIHGKLNSRKWGVEKIKYHLRQKHHVSEELINTMIQKIDKENYLKVLQDILQKKKQVLEKREKDKSVIKKKIINFALSKGYDISDIYSIINQMKF